MEAQTLEVLKGLELLRENGIFYYSYFFCLFKGIGLFLFSGSQMQVLLDSHPTNSFVLA